MASSRAPAASTTRPRYFDRTNYFETLPSHQLELGLWLEADRMATLLDALSQENLDNQREVVKNEKRQSYDNRPYGSFYEKLMAAVFPDGHPYHHTPIGSMEDLDAASLDDVQRLLPHLVRAQQRGAHDRGRRRRGARHRDGGALLRAHPGQPGAAFLAPPGRRPGCRRAARWCPTPCPWSASTSATAARPTARTTSTPSRWPPRSWPAAAAAGCTGAWCATSRSPRTWPLFALPLVAGCVDRGRLGHGPTGDRRGDGGAACLEEELQRMTREPVTDDELARARALIESAELGALSRMEEVADRLSMYATYFDRPELHQRAAAALPGRGRRGDPGRLRRGLRRDPRAVITYVPAAPTEARRHERPDRARSATRGAASRAPTTSPTSSARRCPTA